MIKNITCTALAWIVGLTLVAQDFGEIQGKVADAAGVPLPGVVVSCEGGGKLVGEATDEEGGFRLRPLVPGLYTLKLQMTGYTSLEIARVVVNPNQITRLMDLQLNEEVYTVDGGGWEKVEYLDPLINDDGGTVVTIRAKELKNLPSANGGNIKSIVASLSSDIKTSANGQELYFRGSRSGSVIYFIDGVKMRGNVPNIPSSGLSSISVYTGGVPAKYGDSVGGYVVIETKSFLEDYYEKMKR